MRTNRICAVVGLTLAVQACAEPKSASDGPAAVSRAQFDSLTWLIGEWRGSGGQYPAFFESYRWLNDSTIEQKAFSDSTFAVVTDSSELAWRAGSVQNSRDGTVQYVVVRVTGDSLQFAKLNGEGGGFVWVKDSPGRWTAILDPAAGGEPTIYKMERVRP